MNQEIKPGIAIHIFFGILFLFILWLPYQLFHYNHIYKVRDSSNLSVSVYSNHEFEIGDKINWQDNEMIGAIEGHNPTWGDDKQGVITKILR